MRDVSAIRIRPENSITEAVKVIDEGGLGIALVVDEQGRLQGVVTDVDLRKAILGSIPFEAPVARIMSGSPLVGHCNDSAMPSCCASTSARCGNCPSSTRKAGWWGWNCWAIC